MIFVEPEYKELYNKLKNNKQLEKFLIENKALITVDDFYEDYGAANKDYNKDVIISNNNNLVYENLTDLFLKNEETLQEKSVETLVASKFLQEEIKGACGFSSDTILDNDFYWQLFYTYKYCYTDSFFQNNWENFVPEIDFEGLANNEAASGFMDAIMKEFDHMDYIIKNTRKFRSYREIPFEYINYLSQLLGLEQKTFMMESDMEAQYRVLAQNIIDVYRIKGTPAAWELLFNFLGFNVTLEEYYFDRRRYFAISGQNTELGTADNKEYQYYLTTVDPRLNYKEEIATAETVLDSDFTEQKNLGNFNDLVDKYGLMCVLGYDDMYVKTKTYTDDNGATYTGSEELCSYEGDVYKYFKTNYIRVRPTLKYATGNFTTNQLYQLTCLLNFLTPEFCQRELYVVIDTGDTDEKMVMNWSKDLSSDDFYMLDSEDWGQTYYDKYLANAKSYKNSSVPYSATPKVLNDLGEEKTYVNSLGLSSHVANGKYYNVFFNPLSEKIILINSTKYWGDKVKVKSETGKIYPIWRADLNYSSGGTSHYAEPAITKNGSVLKELYLPEHSSLLPNKWVAKNWDNIEVVDLNGFENKSLRRYIKNMKNYVDVKWVTDLPIEIFLKENLTDEEKETWTISEADEATRETLFQKEWKNVSNITWVRKKKLSKEQLEAFIKGHNNIINYDYINRQLFCDNDFTNLGFNSSYDGYEIKAYTSSSEERSKNNNGLALELLNSMDSPDCYYISCNASFTEFYVYTTIFEPKYYDKIIYKYRPEPDSRLSGEDYIYSTYNALVKSFSDDGTSFTHSKTNKTIEISSSSSATFYVTADNMYYKPMLDMTGLKIVIHNQGTNVEPMSTSLASQNYDSVKAAKELGHFLFYNATKNDGQDREDMSYAELKEMRKPTLMQYKYSNIKKNDLIYSTYDKKLYCFNDTGFYVMSSDQEVSNFSYDKYQSIKNQNNVSYNDAKCIQKSTSNVFGVNELSFTGFLTKDEDGSYKLYEYDNSYKGFSEQDDNDNYVFLNYEREIEWKKLGISSTVIKRPIKEYTDKWYDEINTNNETAYNILSEIFLGIEDNFKSEELINWEGN